MNPQYSVLIRISSGVASVERAFLVSNRTREWNRSATKAVAKVSTESPSPIRVRKMENPPYAPFLFLFVIGVFAPIYAVNTQEPNKS